MAAVNWTAEAERWLRDIYDYIAADNPEAAMRVVVSILRHAEILERFPEAGYHYQASERQVRILMYGHYRIGYLIKDDGDIDILGVFHGALDIDRYSL